MNRLARETSPYLRQHKDNPVDWHAWDGEALAEAQAADKPILLSIGYAACHWCHVMAHESFENTETAALINQCFLPIKVDREERPDIDAIYQNALALMGQHGGWPLTMFLTPDGEPFWGGTYYPPERKYGRPAFTDVLKRAAAVYHGRKEIVAKNSGILKEGLRKLSAPAPADDLLTPDTLDEICLKIGDMIDPVEGGLGSAPKFPQSPVLAMLWRGYKRTGNVKLRDWVLLTLDRMSQGGIYDHLGGGYARYAIDNDWLIPHFEKMLYDNAQLVELLTFAWQETKTPLYAARVAETIGWILREMRIEGGAFTAALDADSEHEEGKFYVWAAAEVEAVLGAEASLFKSHYDVHRIGNWEGKTILNRSEKPQLMDAETEARLAASREKLWAVRECRVRPGRDHKILADWNGLTIAALCLAGEAFARTDWTAAAKDAFAFVVTKMVAADGRLLHSWCDGRTHLGILDDYAAMSKAALALYEVTREKAYLTHAMTWCELLNIYYADAEQGGFYFTPSDAPELITRICNAFDNATPSGNGMMVQVLAALYHHTGNRAYRDQAERLIGAFAGEAMRNSVQLASFLSGMDFLLNTVQIVICLGEGGEALLHVVAESCIPNRLLSVVGEEETIPPGHPAAGKTQIGNVAAAYVCIGERCLRPVTDPALLRGILSRCGTRVSGFGVNDG